MNKKLIDGLPFTVDYKEMVKKSINNLSLDPDQYLKEITTFALANNPSRIDIIHETDLTEVSFDGPAIASKDELKSLLMNIYNSGEDGKRNNLGMLGRSVVASLKTKPIEVIIKTTAANLSYIMRIDSKLDQELLTIDKPSTKNSFTVIKRKKKDIKPLEIMINSYNYAKKTSVSDSLADIYNKSLYCTSEICKDTVINIGDFMNNFNKKSKSRFESSIKDKLKTICSFSEIPVYLNKEKINHGFTFPDTLYEKKYKFDDITILVSFSKNNHIKDVKRTIYIKNNLSVYQPVHFLKDTSSFYYQLFMDIAVDAPGIEMNISGEQIIEDNYFNSLKGKISEAKNLFNKDILKNIKQIETNGKEELRRFITVFLCRNSSEEYRAKIKNTKLFSDIDGNEYTISEVSDIIKEQDSELYITGNKLHRSHPLLRDKKKVIFYLESESEEELIKNLSWSSPKIIHYDRKIQEYEREKKQKQKQSRKKTINAITKTAGWTASSSGVLATSYYGTIFISPYAVEYWYYAPIAAACAGGVYAGVRGIAAAGRKISESGPEALDYTLQKFEKIGNIINHNSWINKSAGSCGKSFKKVFESSWGVLEAKLDKMQKNKASKNISKIKKEEEKKPIEKLDTMIQEYIHALKQIIFLDSTNSELGTYFRDLKKIEIKEKSILSPLFSLEKYSGEMTSGYKLIINTRKESLYKKSELYRNSSSAIYYDILNIENMLEKKSGHYYSQNFEEHVLDAVHLSHLEDVVSSFSKGKESFKKDFPMLSKTERGDIIKQILCEEITADNGIEQWLIKNYNHELRAVAKEEGYKDD